MYLKKRALYTLEAEFIKEDKYSKIEVIDSAKVCL